MLLFVHSPIVLPSPLKCQVRSIPKDCFRDLLCFSNSFLSFFLFPDGIRLRVLGVPALHTASVIERATHNPQPTGLCSWSFQEQQYLSTRKGYHQSQRARKSKGHTDRGDCKTERKHYTDWLIHNPYTSYDNSFYSSVQLYNAISLITVKRAMFTQGHSAISPHAFPEQKVYSDFSPVFQMGTLSRDLFFLFTYLIGFLQ